MMNVQFLQVRREKELSQGQLAELAGCQPYAISMIEAQAWTPPPELQARLAEALGSDIDSLFGQVADRVS